MSNAVEAQLEESLERDDIQVLQKFLIAEAKLGQSSALQCAEILVKNNADSAELMQFLPLWRLKKFFENSTVSPYVMTKLEKIVRKVADVEATTVNLKDLVDFFMTSSVGLGRGSATICAKVLFRHQIYSVATLKSYKREDLDKILTHATIPAFTKNVILDSLFDLPAKKVQQNRAECIEIIENYLTSSVKLGKTSAIACAELFVDESVDSIPVLKRLSTTELNAILNRATNIPSFSKSFIVESMQKVQPQGSKISEEEIAAKMAERAAEAEELQTEVVASNDAFSKANTARLDSILERLNEDSPSKDWKATVYSMKDIAGKLNTELAKDKGVTTITTGNYETYQEMANSMSDGALRKAVRFINGPGFGSRGACALFDFVESAKKYKDMQVMYNPKLDYSEVVTYTSEAQSSFESMQKNAMSSDSYSVKIKAFYGGYSGAVETSGGFSVDRKSEKSSTTKNSSYTTYKTTSTIVTMNSFQINLCKICLDQMAIQDFRNVSDAGKAEKFLMNYGTHVLLSPQSSGGIYNSTATITFTSAVSESERTQAVSKSMTFRGAMSVAGPAVAASAGFANTTTNADAQTELSSIKEEKYSYQHNVKTIGPQVLDFKEFHGALSKNNKVHCLVSNGFMMGDPTTWANKPVWEVLVDAPELQSFENRYKVAGLLRESWLTSVLVTTGPYLETFMTTMVNQSLNREDLVLPGKVVEHAKWARKWGEMLGIRQWSDKADEKKVPINVWCVIASDELDMASNEQLVLEIPYGEPWHNIRLEYRNDGASQLWRFTPQGYLENFSGYVITCPNHDLTLLRRGNLVNQKFFFDDKRRIVSQRGKYMVFDANASDGVKRGTSVNLSSPHDGKNQKWNFIPVELPSAVLSTCPIVDDIVGKTCVIVSDDKKVLDVRQNSAADRIWVYEANGARGQRWTMTANGHLKSDIGDYYLQLQTDGKCKLEKGVVDSRTTWTLNDARHLQTVSSGVTKVLGEGIDNNMPQIYCFDINDRGNADKFRYWTFELAKSLN